MMHIIKKYEKRKSLYSEPGKRLEVKGHMWGFSVSFSSLKSGRNFIDTRLEEEFKKIESSPNVRVFHEDFSYVYSIHINHLKALGCPRLLSIFYKMISEDFPDFPPEIPFCYSDFLEMIGVDSPGLLLDGTFPE
ncbi:hypothetical protein ES705_31318 [subsurface metagenome]